LTSEFTFCFVALILCEFTFSMKDYAGLQLLNINHPAKTT
jgi:hypothetical protein